MIGKQREAGSLVDELKRQLKSQQARSSSLQRRVNQLQAANFRLKNELQIFQIKQLIDDRAILNVGPSLEKQLISTQREYRPELRERPPKGHDPYSYLLY